MGCEMDSCPSIALTLKKDTKTYFESNEPPQKFIRPPFLKKNVICPPVTTYNPCPEVCGGGWSLFILKDIISGSLNYAETNSYLKALAGCVWENDGRGTGTGCPQITLNN